MGKGIAVEFRRRWPEMYEAYRESCRRGDFTPGDVFVWETPELTIFNLGTQKSWRTPATLGAVEAACAEMFRRATEAEITSIAMPRIASGLGSLDWPDVRAVIEDLVPRSLDLVVYSPTQ